MHNNRVCLLSHAEYKALENWNRRPNCRHHKHVSRAEANSDQTIEFLHHPGPRRAHYKVQFTLQKVYVRSAIANIHALAANGRRSQLGPGQPTMQLVRGSR